MPPQPDTLDPDEVAVRAALLLGAPAAAIVHAEAVLGQAGLDEAEVAQVSRWLAHDPISARPHGGDLRRIARAPWPGQPAVEVWVLGGPIRRLPNGAYDALHDFLGELATAA